MAFKITIFVLLNYSLYIGTFIWRLIFSYVCLICHFFFFLYRFFVFIRSFCRFFRFHLLLLVFAVFFPVIWFFFRLVSVVTPTWVKNAILAKSRQKNLKMFFRGHKKARLVYIQPGEILFITSYYTK